VTETPSLRLDAGTLRRPSSSRPPAGAVAQIQLLDSFDVVIARRSVPLPFSAQRVLAFVALHDHPLKRVYVAGSLWLDAPEERAAANLRSALWRIHRGGVPLVNVDAQQVQLNPRVIVDLHVAEELARRALDASAGDALSVEPGDLGSDVLPDWYEDWVVLERERYRQLRLLALDTLCVRLTDAGHPGAALEAGLAAVASEPLRESAHRAVIRAHLADNNVGEALRQYRLCRRLLREQLGVAPSAQMQELVSGLDARKTLR
jgi:DNA-binding SARP family transcriptional activator